MHDADRPTHAEAITQLAEQLKGGGVQTLLILGGNPRTTRRANWSFAKLIAAVPNCDPPRRLLQRDVVRSRAWHLPKAHYLECWGDARAYDGTVSVQQPLIEPLFGGMSSIELLAMLTAMKVTAGRDAGAAGDGADAAAGRG